MEYKIIQSSDPQVFVDKVNQEIDKGWRPAGGVAVSSWGDSQFGVDAVFKYVQALVRG